MSRLGRPRRHRRATSSTNADAIAAAAAGAPHGTLISAAHQTDGRGRQGRSWAAPPGEALLMSMVLRSFDELLPLRAGLAVAEAVGPRALVKWPNDVLVDGRKVAGILAERCPGVGAAVVGIGVNVAVDLDHLPPSVRDVAGTLGLAAADVEPTLRRVLERLDARLSDEPRQVLAALRERDALSGRHVSWRNGSGMADGLSDDGGLVIRARHDGRPVVLRAGEIHLLREPVDGG